MWEFMAEHSDTGGQAGWQAGGDVVGGGERAEPHGEGSADGQTVRKVVEGVTQDDLGCTAGSVLDTGD